MEIRKNKYGTTNANKDAVNDPLCEDKYSLDHREYCVTRPTGRFRDSATNRGFVVH